MRFAPGVVRVVSPLLVATAILIVLAPSLSLLGIALTGAALAFYRDPDRRPPETGVVSPADGSISVIRREDDRVRVGVFMSPTDVHVNRAPLDGTVDDVTHTPGAHRPAFSKDSDRNERLRITCEDYDITLIAGWFARRITAYIETGDSLERGQRIGHIAFGSRVDVTLPPTIDVEDLTVEAGDSVRAGETVLAPDPTDSD